MPGRQVGHHHVELVFLFPLVEPFGCILAGFVGVEGEHEAAGEPSQHLDVFLGEGGTARGHRPVEAHGGEAVHVGVALADDGFAVVAGEIRKLADRAADSTGEFAKLIGETTARIEHGADVSEDAERSAMSCDEIARSCSKLSDEAMTLHQLVQRFTV